MSTYDRMSRWRINLALALWVGGFFLPLAIPLVVGLPLPMATKTAVSGLLVLGFPQVLTLIAIAIVGRSGFHCVREQLICAAKTLKGRHNPGLSLSANLSRPVEA